ncbi:hypothetical protein SBRCBS47491_004298 [Sporothrix bragantina]|uniref:Urease accessory protein n=1 Tax=Sporothrix bragantina TaxID=671064 RepID=A0ABP0BMN6_9PEZI
MDDPLSRMDSPLPRMDGLVAIDHEIAELEAKLREVKLRRQQERKAMPEGYYEYCAPHEQRQHFLILLSDSALPLGSFAFSSGLESFLAHDKAAASTAAKAALAAAANALPLRAKHGPDAFAEFLPLSVSSYAHASLPFVLAAHDAAIPVLKPLTSTANRPSTALDAFTAALIQLDDTYDATIICTVGRRASVAQGRALLSIWERSFASALTTTSAPDPLKPFARVVKQTSNPPPGTLSEASAHMPPLFGAVAALAGLDRRQTADVFVLAHIKALLSAAVRANLLGPYQAQKMLASGAVQRLATRAVEDTWEMSVDEAGQTVPVVDLWMGRHEMLYSRIFNS